MPYFLKYVAAIILHVLQALAPIGALLGCFLGGYVTNTCGRKASLLIVALPYFIGYLIIVYSQFITNTAAFVAILFVGRFITGVGLGWSCLAVPVSSIYVSISLCR